MRTTDRRDRFVVIRLSDEEKDAIRERMKDTGSINLSGFARKMMLEGILVTLDFPELKEVNRLLRYAGNNLNQLAKKANAGVAVYPEDVEDIRERFDGIYEMLNNLNRSLSKLI